MSRVPTGIYRLTVPEVALVAALAVAVSGGAVLATPGMRAYEPSSEPRSEALPLIPLPYTDAVRSHTFARRGDAGSQSKQAIQPYGRSLFTPPLVTRAPRADAALVTSWSYFALPCAASPPRAAPGSPPLPSRRTVPWLGLLRFTSTRSISNSYCTGGN